MMKNIANLDVGTLAEQCANDDFILPDELTECALQSQGKELLSGMRNQTMAQYNTIEHTPWITINGLHSSLGESDLKQAVCNNIQGDLPNYCYQQTPTKVKILFDYSSLDSATQNYVLNELYPHYRTLEDIIDLDLVPFGQMDILSTDSGNYSLFCPNGVDECRGNLVHACLYDIYVNNDSISINDENEYDGKLQYIQFLNCYFGSALYPWKNIDAAEACIEEIFNDIWSTVNECAHSNLGIQIVLQLQDKVSQLLPEPTYTPWIMVNGLHNYAVENHFERTICDAYTVR